MIEYDSKGTPECPYCQGSGIVQNDANGTSGIVKGNICICGVVLTEKLSKIEFGMEVLP